MLFWHGGSANAWRVRRNASHAFTTEWRRQMKMRALTWQVIGLAVLASCLAVPEIGQAGIRHRYSFSKEGDTVARDSVGGADGNLNDNVQVSGGQLILNADSTHLQLTSAGYVDLPIGDTIGSLTNATFETWCTWDHRLGQTWSRVFDFGNDTTTNMFFTLRTGNTQAPRFSITTNGGGNEEQLSFYAPVALRSPTPIPPTTNVYAYANTAENGTPVETHLVVTIDAVNQIATAYINGVPAATNYNYDYNPSIMGSTTNNYLGKSQYADPYFSGSINEFRIYDRALSAAEIAANFAAGPDGTPP
jgi:hypothetical protein